MLARVKADCQYPIITAFGGLEFVQYEFRQVPAGQEESAQINPYLDTALTEDEVKSQPAINSGVTAEVARLNENPKKRGRQ